jgi:hypothetical protein
MKRAKFRHLQPCVAGLLAICASAGLSQTRPSPAARSQTPATAPSLVSQPAAADLLAAPAESGPAEKDGLSVVIKPIKRSFMPTEPLVLDVTFRNVSTAAFRLPNTPALFGGWMLKAENVTTGKTYTGGIFLPGGAAPTTVSPSDPIAPGDTLFLSITFQYRLNLMEGALEYDAFQKAAGDAFAKVPGPLAAAVNNKNLGGGLLTEFPPGAYLVSLIIRFPNKPNSDADNTPLWKDDVIATNTVEINEGIFPPGTLGSISGLVLDVSSQPAVHAAVSYSPVSEFTYNRPPVPGSPYAANIGRSPRLQTNPKLMLPPARYRGSIPAGFTDDKGAFTIKDLPPGTYIVGALLTVTRANEQSGSMQPVEVKQGAQADLPNPIKLVREGLGG